MLRKIFTMMLLLSGSILIAQTQLPSLFSDHMVLQQNTTVNLWGTDNPKEKITVTTTWGAEASAKTGKNGKWRLQLETTAAGGPYSITVSGSEEVMLKDVLLGEVWFASGQSNMEMPVKGYRNQPITGSNEEILRSDNDQLRMFSAKRQVSMEPLNDIEGQWNAASPATTGDFSATAYFFGKRLQEMLGVPVGLVHSSWGGSTAEAWMDAAALEPFPERTIPETMPERYEHHAPSLLFNGMLNPFIGYTMRGTIWYQGESNRKRATEYQELFPAMIERWRELWDQGSFPFYFAQIAPYGYEHVDSAGSAFLREAQLVALNNTENTGMAVTMDIGDCDCIHPADKKTVGNRLAYWALANDYGMEGVAFRGPEYREMELLDNGRVKLHFDHTGEGLSFYENEPAGFEVAGNDQVFYPAKAVINRDKTLTVWCDKVPEPAAVRYAFKNCIDGVLYNVAGLPASSFRTDNW